MTTDGGIRSEAGDTTVLLADDHAPTRAGVRAVLEENGFSVVGEASSAAQAVELALEHRPELCVLDIHMPGGGVAACSRISAELPSTTVVMLTVSRNDADLFEALRAGAAGYLLKDIDPDLLPVELRSVLEGEAALPRSLVTRLVDEFRGGKPRRRLGRLSLRTTSLTSREWEVLDLMGEGLTTAEMAKRMFVSPVTVRGYVASLLRKLQVKDRTEAVELLRSAED